MSRLQQAVADETDTATADWVSIDGPETGAGIERWFMNKHTGEEAYVCDNQGDITVSLAGMP